MNETIPVDGRRRRTLRGVSALLATLAGCVHRPGADEQPSPTATPTQSPVPTVSPTRTGSTPADTPTEALNEIYLELEPAQLDQEQLEWIDLLQFEDLPDGEREIVNVAIKSESYTERWPWSESLKSLVDRIEERRYSQIDTYQEEHSGNNFPGYLDAVYIVKDNQYYHVFLVVKDVVVSA